jgi:hypothetical protein
MDSFRENDTLCDDKKGFAAVADDGPDAICCKSSYACCVTPMWVFRLSHLWEMTSHIQETFDEKTRKRAIQLLFFAAVFLKGADS